MKQHFHSFYGSNTCYQTSDFKLRLASKKPFNWENCLMAALTSKLELQGFLWRNFNSQRTCVANSTVLSPIKPKIQASKVLEFSPSCANEYAKDREKEKNMTIFTKYHEQVQGASDYKWLLTSYYTCIIGRQRLFYIVRWSLQWADV